MQNSTTQALADKITVALNNQIAFDGSCVARADAENVVKIEVDSLLSDFEEVLSWVGNSEKGTVVEQDTNRGGVHTATVELERKTAGKQIVDELGI